MSRSRTQRHQAARRRVAAAALAAELAFAGLLFAAPAAADSLGSTADGPAGGTGDSADGGPAPPSAPAPDPLPAPAPEPVDVVPGEPAPDPPSDPAPDPTPAPVPSAPPVAVPDLPVPEAPIAPPADLPVELLPAGPPLPAAEVPSTRLPSAAAAPVAVRSGYATDAPSRRAPDRRTEPPTPPDRGRRDDVPAGRRAPGGHREQAATRRRARPRGTGALPGPATAAALVPALHTVQPGEHLWAIATAHLAVAHGRPAASLSAVDVAPYWARVCAANRERLRSGDPNLVSPGEVVELPGM